jgi:hypothetical protein
MTSLFLKKEIMSLKILLAAFLLTIHHLVLSQTYFGTVGIIPDDGTQGVFYANVSGLSPSTIDPDFGLQTVCITLLHPWDADLDIALMAPDSTFILLTSGLGGDGDNYTNTCFNGNVDNPIIKAWAPFTGTYRPIGDLGVVNNGQNGNGSWRLCIFDTWPGADQGTLLYWSITFGDQPSLPMPFESSNLPIVVINTHGQFIPDDPKMMADMGIIDNGPDSLNHLSDPFNGYDGYIGIERRGSSSQSFPKKSFGFETWDEAGNDTSISILGMPAENDWILNANFSDKSLMRNVMTYHLSNHMNRYAPRTRYCELFLNDQYWGVYIMMEKIKRDNDRVDIARLDPWDTTGIDLTGGYILKIDKSTGAGGQGWTSPYQPPVHPQGQTIYFQYEYPQFEDLQPQQIEYIQAYVDTFETALYNFGEKFEIDHHDYMDIQSFVDYFILNELSKNVDGYRLSTFFYKDRSGKITMGPLWDFDIAWHNADYCNAYSTIGWAYDFGDYCSGDYWQIPFWWNRLLTDTLFVHTLRCDWDLLRTTTLSDDSLMAYIDGVADTLAEAQGRNFVQWPILGYWIWPNPYPLAETYEEEIQALKTWILIRLEWLDDNIPGDCPNVSDPEITPAGVNIYPNPAKDFIVAEFSNPTHGNFCIELYNLSGRKVSGTDYSNGGNIFSIDISGLPEGMYFVKISSEEGVILKKIFKI